MLENQELFNLWDIEWDNDQNCNNNKFSISKRRESKGWYYAED